MRDEIDDMLESMSSEELRELQGRIHDAVRAQIRLKNAQKAAAAAPRPAGAVRLPQVEQSRKRSLAVHARTRNAAEAAAAANAIPGSGEQPVVGDGAFDLERERDAWLARKRSTAG